MSAPPDPAPAADGAGGDDRVGAVRRRLDSVRERVRDAAERSGRDPGEVQLLAVTKGQPVAAVDAAWSLGLLDVGESRVQEAQGKQLTSRPGLRWHMVGHVQRNKARAVASMFDAVHSVDSVALAQALARHRAGTAAPLRVFVEVELTGLPARTGVTSSEAGAVVEACRDLDGLEPVGLMTIAPPGPPERAAECFAQLVALRDRLRESAGVPLGELSMGMSDDFETAIAHGSTVIRLGRVLFGDRPAARA